MITPDEVKNQFRQPAYVEHYADAAINIGLWRSEEAVFTRTFGPNDTLLELGCGAGRISIGLWELGYRQLLGTDFSREMIEAARRLARRLDYAVPFRVADATALPFDDGLFDGAIFGFNGLMQIPGRARRVQALTEIRRVTRDGGSFVLTTHDREVGGTPGFWHEENERWMNGTQSPRLGEFGDLLTNAGHGEIFIHIPRREEIMDDLTKAGWTIRDHWLRSEIGEESVAVKAFSTDCRFWIAQNEITLPDTVRTE